LAAINHVTTVIPQYRWKVIFAMQIGYNNDVEYRDETFHIQTEDHGEPAAAIETQIFHGGAILDTSIISYKEMLEETEDVDERIAKVRAMMKGNHKKLYKKLFAGEYDEMVGLEPLDDSGDVEVQPEEFEPSQLAVADAALDVERGEADIEDLVGAQPEGQAVGLDELQAQLNADAEKAEAAGSGKPAHEPDDAPTLMLNADSVSDTIQTTSIPRPRARKEADSNVVDFPATGASAWRGCNDSDEDLNIVPLVEEFAGG
jgi:hypothetical protein